MKSRVQKWGNSLAVRIPKSIAEQAGLDENAPIDISLTSRTLLIKRASEGDLTLDALLAGITVENRHTEWETGLAVGKEAW